MSDTASERQMKRFEAGLKKLMQECGVLSMVADVQFADRSEGLWLPGCKPTCLTHDTCHAANFLKAAQNLQSYVVQYLEEQAAELDTDGETPEHLN